MTKWKDPTKKILGKLLLFYVYDWGYMVGTAVSMKINLYWTENSIQKEVTYTIENDSTGEEIEVKENLFKWQELSAEPTLNKGGV